MKNHNIISLITLIISVSLSTGSFAVSAQKQDTGVNCKTKYIPDYDDGETIYVNVKIAIDQKGWNEYEPGYFKAKLNEQWNQINARFNNSDKKHQLKRKYIYKPDLEDIIVYQGCSYWGENGANTKVIQQMDTTVFKLVVIYDFFYDGAEKGEHGGGCGNDNGIGTILVINGSEAMKNKYNDHFGVYTYRAITHELGHFRGVIDLYTAVVKAENNPVNNEGYSPVSCLMNDYCYTPDTVSSWSDYAVKIINKSGNVKRADLIDALMYEDFANRIVINTSKNGKPVNAKISFYPANFSFETWKNTIIETPDLVVETMDGKYSFQNSKELFYKDINQKRNRTQLFLVEALDSSGKKQYTWLSDYNMHNSGLDGSETYVIDFEF